MNNLTRVLLVFLRLAIGWHFFFEGWEKIESINKGETVSSRPFTSAGYLSESTGPLGPFFRSQVPDNDEAVLDHLLIVSLPPGQDPAKIPPHIRLPPQLAKEWNDYFQRFVEHYHLSDQQKGLAEKKLQQREDNTVNWLLTGTKKVKKNFPSGSVEVEETNAQRIQEYRSKVAEVREMETQLLAAFGKDVLKEKFRAAKAEKSRMRTELLADLKEQTAAAQAALQEVLTPEQKKLEAMGQPQQPSRIKWIDNLTAYGLTIIGACLLLGLLTRLACLGGAAFLLLLYLAIPPFPWLPEPARTEGHYLFVSKNLIEMIALLALATTPSGRWAGLDGLIWFLNPWRRRRMPADASELIQADGEGNSSEVGELQRSETSLARSSPRG